MDKHTLKTPKSKMPLKIIDSTTIPLNLNHFKWAEFRKTKSGYKLHLRLVFNPEGSHYPDKEIMTNAKEHDQNQLEVLVDEKETMYVFDRGYVDYKRFDSFTDDGLFFVCRLKKNAVIHVVETFELPKESAALTDKMVYTGSTAKRMENVFRIIDKIDRNGKEMRLITNRFDISADEISEIYRSRWAIELFSNGLNNMNQTFLRTERECREKPDLLGASIDSIRNRKQKTLLQITRWLKATL